MLLQIFSGASVLLGLYILLTNLFFRDESIIHRGTTYHLGCYDSDNHNNHSLELTEKLSNIQSKIRQSTQLNMYYSKTLRPDFDKDVWQIAKSFQSYLDQYYKLKNHNDENINYFNSLHLAKMEYQQCADRYKLDQLDCVSAWNLYKQSQIEFNELKEDISELVDVKEKVEVNLSSLFFKRSSDSNEDIEGPFLDKIKQLKTKLDSEQENLIKLKANRNKIKSQISYYESDLTKFRNILDECITNLQLIKQCNRIHKQIHKIQDMTPKIDKKELQSRISKKLLIINGLQASIHKSKRLKLYDQVAKLEEQLKNQKNELKLLEFQIYNFQTIQESKCAMCSEERIKQLRQNISDLEAKTNQLNQNSRQIDTQIIIIQGKVVEYKKNIDIIQQDRDAAIRDKFFINEESKSKRNNQILQKEKTLNQLKKEIIDKQIESVILNKDYEIKLNNLRLFLQPIDNILNCIRKKQYYQQLKKHAPPQPAIDRKMNEAKTKMVQKLHDFEL